MTDKTDKKTETGKNVQVETTVKPERDPVANPKLPEKEAAKTASTEDIAPKSEPAAPMPPPKTQRKRLKSPVSQVEVEVHLPPVQRLASHPAALKKRNRLRARCWSLQWW